MHDTPTTPTKLSAWKPRGRKRDMLRAWLNADASRDLAYLRATYADLTGQEVSTSPIVRRALAVLADHLRGSEGDTAAGNAEQAALLRAIR